MEAGHWPLQPVPQAAFQNLRFLKKRGRLFCICFTDLFGLFSNKIKAVSDTHAVSKDSVVNLLLYCDGVLNTKW